MTQTTFSMQELVERMKQQTKKTDKKKTPHEKAAIVDEIIALVGESKKYNYGYWLRKIGKISFGEMQGILKQVRNADPKYNKGGMLTNILKKRNSGLSTVSKS